MWNKILKYPLLNVAIIILLTFFFGYGASKLKTSTDVTEMIPKSNEIYLNNEKQKEIYGTSDTMFIGIKSKSGNIITIKNLKTINEITDAIENLKKPERKSDKKSEDSNQPETADYSDMLSDIENSTGNVNISNTTPTTEIFDSVNSITSIELIESVNGELTPIKMKKYIPDNEKELALFKEKIFSWEINEGNFYSSDFKSSSIVITFMKDTDDLDQEYAYNEINKIIKEKNNGDFEYYVAGMPIIKTEVSKTIKKDLMVLIPFVSLVLLFVLYLSFRSVRNVMLPMIAVLIATIWTVGIMGFLGFKLSIIGVLIPVLLIAIGSAYGIHIISHYIEERSNKQDISKSENREIIIETLKKVFIPVLLSALTTFFGFMSLLTMQIIPIREFGIFLGVGVLIELMLSVFFIPSLLILLKPKKLKIQMNSNNLPVMEVLMLKMIKALKTKKLGIIITIILGMIALGYGASRLIIDFDTLKFFKSNSQIVKATNFMDKNLSGSDTIYLNISGQNDGDMTNPDILAAMDNLASHLKNNYKEVGNVIGFNDLIKRMNQVMNYPDNKTHEDFLKSQIKYEDMFKLLESVKYDTKSTTPSYNEIVTGLKKVSNTDGLNYYEIPQDPDKYNITESDVEKYCSETGTNYASITDEEKNEVKKNILKRLISQYLVLYSGSMDEMIATDQIKPKMAKMTITLKEKHGEFLKKIKEDISDFVRNNFPEGYTAEISGTAMTSNELNNIVVSGQITSLITSVLIVLIFIAFSYRSIVAGFVSIIPLTLSIFINFALMGFLKLELNIATALIGSLAVGMGVDYAIHFISFYKSNYKKTGDMDKSIELTFLTSGKAIIYNAASVGLGFAVLLFSNTQILGTFGILITIVMFTSSIGSLVILPLLIETFKPKFFLK